VISSCKFKFPFQTREYKTNYSQSLQHKFEVENKDGSKETRLSTLVEYGSSDPNGYSAMAKLGKCSP